MTSSESERQLVMNKLEELKAETNKSLHKHECTTAYIFKKAVTKAKRQELLTLFFRGVFAEVSCCCCRRYRSRSLMTQAQTFIQNVYF